jgi:hypothetical protein
MLGNVGDCATSLDVSSQAVGIVGLSAINDCASGERDQQRFSACQIMRLSGRNQQLERPALAVDARVDNRSEPATASPHAAISTLFLTSEACW